MVRGLCTQRSGVGFRGEVGPKAPMVLGTKSRSPCSAAMSRMLCSPTEKKKKYLHFLLKSKKLSNFNSKIKAVENK